MILKGNLHGDGAALARYMLTGKDGEIAEFMEARGLDFFGGDPVKAFDLMQRMAEATTKSTMPFFHGQNRAAPGERLTKAQVIEIADREEKRLGFGGHPRMISVHTEIATGEKNYHVAWFRMDVERGRMIDPGLFKFKLAKELAREIEKDFGLRIVSNNRQPGDRAKAAKRNEFEQSRRLDTDDRKIRNAILERFEQSDGGKAFAAAMAAQGCEVTNGDRRNCFVVIDQAGGFHALNKGLTGKTLAEIEARFADLDRSHIARRNGCFARAGAAAPARARGAGEGEICRGGRCTGTGETLIRRPAAAEKATRQDRIRNPRRRRDGRFCQGHQGTRFDLRLCEP